MKVPWPLSAREALVHFFVLEYFQDDLIMVLLNSISDVESINRSTHGFTKDWIPDAKDVVRIDVVGGLALQKVAATRSYFRTIANMDIKLDFVPPALINFVSRQLIGSGFRLYQKEVASVSKGDEDFAKALKESLYSRIQEALYPDNISKGATEQEDHKSDTCILPEEHSRETTLAGGRNMDEKVLSDDHATHSAPVTAVIFDQKVHGEIEEIEEEEIKEDRHLEEDSRELYNPPTNQIIEKSPIDKKNKVVISAEVEQALGTLEKVISIFREYGFHPETLPGFNNEKFLDLEEDAAKDSKYAEDGQIWSNAESCVELSKTGPMEGTSHEPGNSSCSHSSRRTGSNSYVRQASHNRIAPASPEEDIPNPNEPLQTALCSSVNETMEAGVMEIFPNGGKLVNTDANGIKEHTLTKTKKKKLRLWCLHFICGQQTD